MNFFCCNPITPKTISIAFIYFAISGCSTNYTQQQDAPFVAKQSAYCPGFNKKYAFKAITWTQSGDTIWHWNPLHFLGAIFNIATTSPAATALMEYDDNQEIIRIRLFTSAGDQLSEAQKPGKLIECNATNTLIHATSIISGDGNRENALYTIKIHQLSQKIKIDTRIELSSSLLFLNQTRRLSYLAEFNEVD